MRVATILAWGLLCATPPAMAEISVNIGFNVGAYPELVAVPDYPVYYAPQLEGNLFFYDGLYWVFAQDRWYSSSWYNGPWDSIDRESVPLFILRIPVRFYRQPPSYFNGWSPDAPPRWGSHWGQGWEQEHRGWSHWDRGSAPRPAPLPVYQRDYSGTHYPAVNQQRTIRDSNYHYTPRESGNGSHAASAGAQPSRQPRPVQGGSAPQVAPAADTRRQNSSAAVGSAPTRERTDPSATAGRPVADTVRPRPDRAPATQQPNSRDAQPQPPTRSESQRPAPESARRSPAPASPSRAESPNQEARKVQPERGPAQRPQPPPAEREQASKRPPPPEPKQEPKREPDRENRGSEAPPHA